MTKEEVLEKYGEVKLKFHWYYKYVFVFRGISEDGTAVIATIGGGDSYDIYGMKVTPDKEETLHTLCPNSVEILKDGELIAVWSDF